MESILGETAYNAYKHCKNEQGMLDWKELDQMDQLIWSIVSNIVGIKILDIEREKSEKMKCERHE